ncbi:immunoglobulin superfamily member 1-like [Pseudophryne corroboree]|uniref:immunoglobulin superfamily member 1-like n=1 Tax=Pseudophryne corroboree TaxID=495146 RepID=UPI003081E194
MKMSQYIFICVRICFILGMKQCFAYGKLHKPNLEVLTDNTDDVIIIGETVHFHCTNSSNADKFFLTKETNSINVTREQFESTFAITNVNNNDSGLYSCKYSCNSEISEPSDPVDIYVSNRYPPPTITVVPRNVVQPGEDITIMCSASYSNIIFTLYKGDTLLVEDAKNPLSYIIRNAKEKDVGQYMCNYRTKPDNELQIQSTYSDPMIIRIKELPRPSLSWSSNSDTANDAVLNISCTAPVKYKRMWFQLLNTSKDIEDEIKSVSENHVTFVIRYPDHSQKKYYCIYRIKMGDHFADSIISDPAIIWAGDDNGHIKGNIIRLFLSVLILMLMSVIIVKHFKSFQETKRHLPNLPTTRKKLAVNSDYTQMVIMKTEDVLDEAFPNTDNSSTMENVETPALLQSERTPCEEDSGEGCSPSKATEVTAEQSLGHVSGV